MVHGESTLRWDRHGWLSVVGCNGLGSIQGAAGLGSEQSVWRAESALTSGATQAAGAEQSDSISRELRVRHCPSPNYDTRVDDEAPYLLVIHNISLPPYVFGGPYIEQLFTNCLEVDRHPFFKEIAHLRVSAHFLIRRDGEIVQFVSADKRAWHAGVSQFEGREACNNFSIGIEMEGSDFEPFCDAQYQALAVLSKALRERYTLRAVRGHEHIAPVRKTDPGPFFDWQRYRREAGWSWRVLPGLGRRA